MLDSVYQKSEGERLGMRDGVLSRGPIREHAGQIGNIGDPSPSFSRSSSITSFIGPSLPLAWISRK
jgi:hypothetical protein